MKAYGRTRQTTASPQRVWALWSDPANWNRWNTGIRSSQLDGPLAEGATGTMQTARGSTRAVTFTDIQPGTRFTMTMAGPPMITITFHCEIAADCGGSILSQSVTFSGPLGFLAGTLLGNQMASHFDPVLAGLSSAAEEPDPRAAP